MNAAIVAVDWAKATVALANRLARIVWATWKYERPYNGDWSAAATR